MTTTSTPSPESNPSTVAPPIPTQESAQVFPVGESELAPTGQGADDRREAHRRARQQLGMWFLFAVVFAVLPTLGQYLSGRQMEGYVQPGFFVLASKAQLYVVSMGLAASALGQALWEMKLGNFPSGLVPASVGNVLILAVTTYLAATADGQSMNATAVGQQSTVILIATLLTAGSSTYLCERGKAR